jgi:drug/metabolite transporter (DMT)-like permease
VFAGIAGYVNGERLGAVEILGAAVILAGIAVAELGPGRARADAEDQRAEAELEARLR